MCSKDAHCVLSTFARGCLLSWEWSQSLVTHLLSCPLWKSPTLVRNFFTREGFSCWCKYYRQGSTSCAICHPGWENMANTETMDKMENINLITWNIRFMIRNTLFVAQNTLFVNQLTQNTLFYSIFGDNWKINTYMRLENTILDQIKMGEHQVSSNVEPWLQLINAM